MARHLTYEAAIAAQYAIEDRAAPALSPRDMLRRDMAWEAIGDLYFRDDLTMAEKAVAVFLHWFTGHYTNASPAIETIAKRVAAAERTTRAAIKKLAGSEFRMIEGGGSRPHQYLPKFTEETFEKRLRQIQNEPYAERVARLTAPIRRRVLPAECPAQTDEGGAECPAQTLTEINDCPAECPAQTERVNVCPANGTDDNKDSLSSRVSPRSDSTLSGSVAAREAAAADPKQIARELWRILRMVQQHSRASQWHTAEINVARWLKAGATPEMILAVGRSVAARGTTDIGPGYLDRPIADAIALASKPMPQPSKDAANGQANNSPRSYRGTVNDVFAKLRAEAVRDGRIDPRKSGDPRDGAIDAEPIAGGGAAPLEPGRIVRANGHGG